MQVTFNRKRRPLISGLAWVYHKLMKKVISSNGRPVIKTVTPSGVTGYVDATISREALEIGRDRLLKQLGIGLAEFREKYGLVPAEKKTPPR